MDDVVEDVVLSVVLMLVEGEYKTLEAMTGGVMLSADHMANAIDQYGHALVMPASTDLLASAVYIEIAPPDPRRLAVDVPLWTADEGRSDLTAQMTLTEVSPGLWDIELNDIRVL